MLDSAASQILQPVSPSTSSTSRSLNVDLDRLAAVMRDANGPVAIQALAREAVRAMIVTDGPPRTYVPGARYDLGERVRLLDGRLGDIVAVEPGENAAQGAFTMIVVRMRDGETVRLAADVADAPETAAPELVTDETVDMLLLGQEHEMARRVRQAMAADPRFITLYHRDAEYGCLREFFPPMSPDVLDAALALLLDELFDQVPPSRLTEAPSTAPEDKGVLSPPAEPLFSTPLLDGALVVDVRRREGDERHHRGVAGAVASQTAASEVFETVHSLWLRAKEQGDRGGVVHRRDEAQFTRVFLQPVLRALGWSSVPLTMSDGGLQSRQEPQRCYALCPDAFSASELYVHPDAEEAIDTWALAILRVGAWGAALDRPARTGGGPSKDDTTELAMMGTGQVGREGAEGLISPAHHLAGDLQATEVAWGILTNGRVWRLVSRDANSLVRTYYEVDLGVVFDDLTSGEAPGRERWEIFRRWWLLFRQDSYVKDQDGRCLLAHLREREPRVERQMRALLRERLLTKALPAIAGGFVAYRHRRFGIDLTSPSELQDIYDASVWLLTRFLFILAAEGRGWLPLSDTGYRPHSLTTQAAWAAERIRRDLPLSDGIYTTPRYDLVLTLLQRIAKGDAEMALPTYGRLLFGPTESPVYQFVSRTRLSDRALGQALDAVFRGIDYASFDARDLIGVCSALLGGQLAVVDADAGDVLITHLGDDRVRSETLPDFVVTSVVEQALAPLLASRNVAFVAAMEDVVAIRRRLRHTLDRQQRSALYADWERAARRARDAFLSIRVCDPAMGAGDFLLSSVDVLTDGIIAYLHAYHRDHPEVPRAWNPITQLLDEVSQDIAEEASRQGVCGASAAQDTQDAAPTDTVVLSRLVAQRTLFGVADDRLAVEVAKVGLWLHTFAVGAPLSFFDHHLMSGNALLGADLHAVAERHQLPWAPTGVLEAVTTLFALTERVDTTSLDVRWSVAQFDRVQAALAPYRRLLDLSVSAGLGTTEAEEILDRVDPDMWLDRLAETAPAWVAAQAEAEGFFHWQLAFPEAYVDLARGTWRETPGFDLIVGAPPLNLASEPAVVDIYATRFQRPDVAYNPRHAFLDLARDVIRRKGGRTAYVLSREWLATPTGGI
jgi:hypothetical protein